MIQFPTLVFDFGLDLELLVNALASASASSILRRLTTVL